MWVITTDERAVCFSQRLAALPPARLSTSNLSSLISIRTSRSPVLGIRFVVFQIISDQAGGGGFVDLYSYRGSPYLIPLDFGICVFRDPDATGTIINVVVCSKPTGVIRKVDTRSPEVVVYNVSTYHWLGIVETRNSCCRIPRTDGSCFCLGKRTRRVAASVRDLGDRRGGPVSQLCSQFG